MFRVRKRPDYQYRRNDKKSVREALRTPTLDYQPLTTIVLNHKAVSKRFRLDIFGNIHRHKPSFRPHVFQNAKKVGYKKKTVVRTVDYHPDEPVKRYTGTVCRVNYGL